jgi:hypothetical protein
MNPKLALRSVAVLAAVVAAGCGSPSSDSRPPGLQFDSAEKAVDALVSALRANDLAQAATILGGGAEEVLHSGDDVSDRAGLATFLAAYDEAHRLEPVADGDVNLLVGRNEWPLPIPLYAEGGRWAFDTDAGLDELLSRRIGRNELDAVQVCLAIVDAQREYASSDPDGDGVQEYAPKFKSDEGKRDGLFWPAKEGEAMSPLGLLVAEAAEQGYAPRSASDVGPRPYRGYHYRILRGQGAHAEGGAFEYVVNGRMIGGFAVLAHPADYANSGMMTFVVNHAGVVFQKDLGEQTAEKARAITAFDPDASWSKVQ